MKKVNIPLIIIALATLLLTDNYAQKEKPSKEQAKKEIEALKTPVQILDSLKIELKNSKPDTNQVNILNRVAVQYLETNPNSGIAFANEAIVLSEKLKWEKGTADSYFNIGNILLTLFKFDESQQNFEKALQISRKIKYNEGIGNNLIGIGSSLAGKKDYLEAKKNFDEAIKTFNEGKNRFAVGKVNMNYGSMFENEGQNDSSIVYFEKAEKIAEENEDLINMRRANKSIGNNYFSLSNYKKALEYYEKALKISEELEDKEEISYGLVSIGFLLIDSSNYPKAKDYFERSLKLFEELGNKSAISYSLINIGLINMSLSYYPKALEYFEQGLAIAEEQGEKRGISFALENIGFLYSDLSNYPKALEYFERSLKIEEEMGDKRGVSKVLFNLAGIFEKLSNFTKALGYYEKALKIKEEIGDKFENQPDFVNIIAMNKEYPSNHSNIIEYYDKSMKIFEELRNKWGITFDLANLGMINLSSAKDSTRKDTIGRVELLLKAKDCFEKATKQFQKMGKQNDQSFFLFKLAETYEALGDNKSALGIYKEANTIQDSIFSSETLKKIFEVETKKDKEIRQKENEVLKKEALLKESELSRRNQELSNSNNIQKIQKLELDKKSLDILSKNNELSLLAKDREVKELEIIRKDIEAEKNANEIELLNKNILYQNVERNSLFGGLLFIFIILILLFLFFKRKTKDNKLLTEKNIQIENANIELTTLNEQVSFQNIELLMLNNNLAQKNNEISIEQEKSEKLLLNILPAPIASRLKEGKTEIADKFEEASVVFIDIVDFTEKSKNATPEQIVDMLNNIYTYFDKIANKHGLEKIKTIGDCYMAAAGVPIPRKDHAESAAKFAFEAMEIMKKGYRVSGLGFGELEIDNQPIYSNTPSPKPHNPYPITNIQFRCGLDCGPVVAGVIGDQKFTYDLWGDTVNTASRMESSGVAGMIQVTERFKEQLTTPNPLLNKERKEVEVFKEWSFEERGEINIKGKGRMRTYFLSEH